MSICEISLRALVFLSHHLFTNSDAFTIFKTSIKKSTDYYRRCSPHKTNLPHKKELINLKTHEENANILN